jgi:protein-tyrosine phosphatase
MQPEPSVARDRAMRHRIDVPGTFNFREIGGHAVRDGRLATGLLFRSDGLSDLGPEGRAALEQLGVRTIVDLRDALEIEQYPSDFDREQIAQREVPILSRKMMKTPLVDLATLYRQILDERGAVVVEAVRALSDPAAMPAVVHCSAGKDRTGVTTALVLAALGVEDEAIVEDYALTAELLRGAPMELIRGRAVEAGLDEQIIAVALDAPREAMRDTLSYLRSTYGGAEDYLLAHGLLPGELAALRSALAPAPALS